MNQAGVHLKGTVIHRIHLEEAVTRKTRIFLQDHPVIRIDVE
jgi:hypothetical protein